MTEADFGKAVTSHIADLRRYARALLGNSSEVDDLVQESLLRALSRIGSHSNIRNVRTYLFAILHNAHVDRITKRSRKGYPVSLDADDGIQLSVAASQEDALRIRDLGWALQQLPEPQRQVVLLVGLEGMNYRQVAEILGIPLGTVMSRLSRGREALRRLMADGHEVVSLRKAQ